jgi:hypothetical protein
MGCVAGSAGGKICRAVCGERCAAGNRTDRDIGDRQLVRIVESVPLGISRALEDAVSQRLASGRVEAVEVAFSRSARSD